MRWLALAVLGACSFSSGKFAGDAGPSGGDARTIDASIIDMALDAAAVSPIKVRSLDITDAMVTGSPHTSFPLLVSLAGKWLTTAGGGGGEVAGVEGFDIYFSAEQDGNTRLAHEVEDYDPVNGILIAWVKVPSLTPQTVIFIHHGDVSINTSQESVAAVWSASYELVVHMEGRGDATAKNTITASGVVKATGMIGAAFTADGNTSNVGAGSLGAVDDIFAGGGTLEGWFYAESFGEGGYGRLFDKGFGTGYSLYVDNSNQPNTITLYVGCTMGNGVGAWAMASTANILTTWHHLAVVYDTSSSANDPSYFLDGAAINVTELDAPSGSIVSDAAIDLNVGNNGANGTRGFNGVLDEMRMSSVIRSDGWVATQFRNQSNPGTFYLVSDPL